MSSTTTMKKPIKGVVKGPKGPCEVITYKAVTIQRPQARPVEKQPELSGWAGFDPVTHALACMYPGGIPIQRI
ncbi:MAG: hypothetical protein ACK5YK_01120 [Pseudomonadota bacterium]